MSFDFAGAVSEGQTLKKKGLLTAAILGQQGGGKSRLIGTTGVKTLYLYATTESHGSVSATGSHGSDIVPVCVDYADGKNLSPDEAFARTIGILQSIDHMKKLGIKAVAFDSATELEAIVRETAAWKAACRTKDGGHNSFAEGTATINMMRAVLSEMLNVQRQLQAHVLFTCALDVKDRASDGEITEAQPRLQGYSVAETFVRMFDDVLVVGEMVIDGETLHRLQFGVDITKVSRDLKTKAVKKMLNLRPRITGVENPPATCDADLKKLIERKAATK